jgi:putative SOS response-associated peptidase YedK
MCGRYVITEDPSTLANYFKVERTVTDTFDVSYNVAPTDPVLAIAEHDGIRQMGSFRWGLVPHWAKDTKGPLNINARAETVATKSSFRDSFRRKRCIVPATGFFEWEPKDRGRLPHYIRLTGDRPMAFAGIWASWKDPMTEQWMRSCSIITTTANDAVSAIHARMPVILPDDRWDIWLDREMHDTGALEQFLHPIGATEIREHAVSTLVNSVRNNLPENIVPLPPNPVSLLD